jgi:hypothetical protein
MSADLIARLRATRVESFGWKSGETQPSSIEIEAAARIEELEAREKQHLFVMQQAADALAYTAFNFDGSKLDDLDPQLVESTGVSETALIAERNLRTAIRATKQEGK